MATRTDKLQVVLEVDGDGQARASVVGFSRDVREVGKAATDASRGGLSDMMRQFGGLKTIIGSLGFVALAKGTIEMNAEFQRLNAGLRTVTGSAAAADREFAKLREFTARTPFQLQEVVEAFVKLKARGLDPSIAALTSYGNTASAMGKSLDQFVEAVGDAATGEMERLRDFGITAATEGEQVAFTFQGMTTRVARDAQSIEGYLRRLGDTDFAGGMALQTEALGGSFSNLQDAVFDLATAIGQSGLNDLVQGLADGLAGIIRQAAGAKQPISELVTELERFQSGAPPSKGGGRSRAATRAARRRTLEAELNEALMGGGGPVGLRLQIDELDDQIAELEARIGGLDERQRRRQGRRLNQDLQGLRAQRDAVFETLGEEELTFGGGAAGGGSAGGGGGNSKEDEKAERQAERLAEQRERFREHLALRFELIEESTLAEEEAERSRYERELETLAEYLEEKMLTEEEHDRYKEILAEQHEQRLTQIHKRETAKREEADRKAAKSQEAAWRAAGGSVRNIMHMLAGESKAMAIASIAVSKGLAIAQVLGYTQPASMLAFASQLIPGDPTSIGRGMAAFAQTQALGGKTAALVAGLTALEGGLQIAQVASGGGGGGGVGGGGGGGAGAPIGGIDSGAPLPGNQAQADTSAVQLIFVGQGGQLDFADSDALADQLRELINERGTVLIQADSPQAYEIAKAARDLA
jgi:hypothetical protein